MSNDNRNERLDLGINNYSVADLLNILDLYNDTDADADDGDDGDGDNILNSISNEDIIKTTNQYINKFSTEYQPDLENFFTEMQYRLLNTKKGYENDSDKYDNKIILPPDILKFNRYETSPNLVMDGGNTDRAPIVPETQNILNTFAPTEVKGTINPLIKNTYSTFINIDSKYRQYSGSGSNSNTDFTLDLSEPLKNLLSLQLYSYQIPFSWYTINTKMGNTCFWIEDPSTNITVTVTIDSGNYTPTSLTTELTTKIGAAGFTFTTPPFTYNQNQGKIIFNLYGGTYTNGTDSFTITENTKIIFFDFSFTLDCSFANCGGTNLPNYINQTLGWILGFRTSYINVNSSGNTPTSLLDLNGPRYLILIIDDYNNNHLNNNLISITEYDNNLKLPSYYDTSLPYSCKEPNNKLNNNNIDSFISNKLNITHTKTQNILPSVPRYLTQSQIYTINEIIKNNKSNSQYFPKAPTNSDVFAIIPIKTSNNIGNIITEFSGSLQSNERIYYGPVDISRLRIQLCDDAGNTLDLNDVNWSFTMIAKCLYEY
jgi:hypothetical protein